MTLEQLGCHRKRIAVLDLHCFFDPLWAQFPRGIDEGFIAPEFLDLWYPAPDTDALRRYFDDMNRTAMGSSGPAAPARS